MLEVRAAAGGVGDDGVERVEVELVEQAAGVVLRHLVLAVVGVERAAAGLVRRRDDGAAVGEQDVGGVAVDVAVDEVLHAAGEQADAVTSRYPAHSPRGCDQVGRELAPHDRRLRLEPRGTLRQETSAAWRGRASAAPRRGRAKRSRPTQPQPPLPREKQVEQQPARKAPQRRSRRLRPLGLGAGHLEELGVIDPGGAGRFAGEAAEAEVHLVRERFRRLQLAVGDGAHEGDAARAGCCARALVST